MRLDSPAIEKFITASGSPQTGRALVPFTKITDLVRIEKGTDSADEIQGTRPSLANDAARLVNVRYVSPSEMSEISLDLYAMGLLSFDDYSALAYHPELHPEYDRTIGALTGEVGAPERKRDFIDEWEEKHRFLTKYSPGNKQLVEQSARITNLLQSLARRTNLRV